MQVLVYLVFPYPFYKHLLSILCHAMLCCRFMFVTTGSRMVLGGTQETLFLVSGSHYVDLEDTPVPLERFIDAATMDILLAGAASTFDKLGPGALMKCVKVRCCTRQGYPSTLEVVCGQLEGLCAVSQPRCAH